MLSDDQIQAARSSLGITPTSASSSQPDRVSALTSAWSGSLSTDGGDKGFLGDALDSIINQAKGGFQEIQQGAKQFFTPPSTSSVDTSAFNMPEGALKIGSGIASIISSPAAPVTQPISKAVQGVGEKFGDIPAVQELAQTPAGVATERVARDVGDFANIVGTAAGVKGAIETAPSVAESIKTPAEVAPTRTPEAPTTQQPDQQIFDNYTRAIKPTVVGKKAPGMYDKYQSNVVDAVKSIVQNKDNLSFTDESGNTESGRLPQSPAEFSQGIDQTKENIFKQYDALAKQAGEKGITIDTKPLLENLGNVVKDESLQITNPTAIQYASDLRDRLSFRQLTPEVTQNVIKNYNSSLESFYKNPSYDNASKAAIDAGVVHQLRGMLSDAINSATGENYQALKKAYGSLSAIEQDVTKRAIVLARQKTLGSAQGLGKYADIFSGGDMVQGLLTLNPGMFAKGATQATLTRFLQYMNSPDRSITNMFKYAESSVK